MNLFVLVSTGAKVSNLPPVLEHASAGDHVLWIESEEARRGNWTKAPRELLEARGLVTAEVIPVSGVNDPVALAAAVTTFSNSSAAQYGAIYLVANGGPKLSPVGLLRGFGDFSPRLLYGDEKPAVHNLYPSKLDAAPDVGPYTRHDLDLHDILQVNGYTFTTKSQHARIWPDPLPPTFTAERYGADEGHTSALHAAHFAWDQTPQTDKRVPFPQLATLARNDFVRWTTAVQNIRYVLNPQNQESLYNSTLKMDEAARRANRPGAVPPPERIGVAFERAVGRRVHEWLNRTPHAAIRSVWAGVKVARDTSPHKSDAEFDVLFVLTNGVLVHLECKSAAVDVRELDAQLHRLRQTGSQLARVAVVLPLYSARAAEPWFAPLHAARTQVSDARLTLVPFTWRGQPNQYTVPGTDPAEVVGCPEFEVELDKLLSAYRP